MARLIIDLPDDLMALAHARAVETGHASLEQYLEALIRADIEANEVDLGGPAHLTFESEDELEALLARRANDEPSIEVTPEFWQQLKERARRAPIAHVQEPPDTPGSEPQATTRMPRTTDR